MAMFPLFATPFPLPMPPDEGGRAATEMARLKRVNRVGRILVELKKEWLEERSGT